MQCHAVHIILADGKTKVHFSKLLLKRTLISKLLFTIIVLFLTLDLVTSFGIRKKNVWVCINTLPS